MWSTRGTGTFAPTRFGIADFQNTNGGEETSRRGEKKISIENT